MWFIKIGSFLLTDKILLSYWPCSLIILNVCNTQKMRFYIFRQYNWSLHTYLKILDEKWYPAGGILQNSSRDTAMSRQWSSHRESLMSGIWAENRHKLCAVLQQSLLITAQNHLLQTRSIRYHLWILRWWPRARMFTKWQGRTLSRWPRAKTVDLWQQAKYLIFLGPLCRILHKITSETAKI